MDQQTSEALKWEKRFYRERAARKEAEKLLEEKSAEIFQLNTELEEKVALEIEKNSEKQKMLFQQSKMASMGEMISNIAHQWRQPLHAIKLVNQKISLYKSLDYEITDELIQSVENDIKKQVDYLNNTIEDFRNFFKPDKSKRSFKIKEAIDLTLNIINSTLKQKHIEVILNLDNNLIITNLKNELMQVLINIIKNAYDALEEKNIPNKLIFINSYEENDKIIIDVIDNAGGIKDDFIAKIFEPYFTTKHKSKGTGLGLYMSHEIITKHMNGELLALNQTFNHKNNIYKGGLFRIILNK